MSRIAAFRSRCHDAACGAVYPTFAALEAHVVKRGHHDAIHQLGSASGHRRAAAGVAAASAAAADDGASILDGDDSKRSLK